jgi:hypothetical protein
VFSIAPPTAIRCRFPDLAGREPSSPGLNTQAPPDELTELFAAFDLTATYDKEQRALRLAATLSPALIPASERPRPPKEAVGEIFHSGGRI